MNKNIQIVRKDGRLFKKYGIKSFTMDDVAHEPGMTKKPLYQIVADKNELIELVVKSDFRNKKNSTRLTRRNAILL